jgi:hypothetical protein
MHVTHFECDRCGERLRIEQTVNDPARPEPQWFPVLAGREVIGELCIACIAALKAFCSRQKKEVPPATSQ